MKGTMPTRLLARLERIHRAFGDGSGAEKRKLVERLGRARLDSAARLRRFHEVLCFLRAYPDAAGLLAEVERALAGFERRDDLVRFREALADSGIAGTPIRYRFFWPMARWLASRWPDRLHFDRDEAEEYEPRLRAALSTVSSSMEAEAVKRSEAETFEILDRFRGRSTDAAWFLRRIESLPGGPFVREAIHDAVDAAYVLDPGRGGPSRTLGRHEGAPIVFLDSPLDRSRQVLPAARAGTIALHGDMRLKSILVMKIGQKSLWRNCTGTFQSWIQEHGVQRQHLYSGKSEMTSLPGKKNLPCRP